MTRTFFAVAVLMIASAVSAAPVPKVPLDPTKDREGNPLPKGATARLGSLAFRGPMIHAVSFSEDGKRLLACSGWDLLSWDAESGRPLPTKSFVGRGQEQERTECVVAGNRVFALEGQQPVPGGQNDPIGEVVVRDRVTGDVVSRISYNGYVSFAPYSNPSERPPSAAVSADGRYLALVSYANRAVETYDTDTGKRLHSQPIGRYLGGTIISPDNKTLYICDAVKPIRRCELVSGKALPDLDGTDPATDCLVVSPDSKLVVTRSTLVVIDAARVVQSIGHDPFLVLRDAVANKTLRKIELGATPVEFAFAGPDALLVVTFKQRSPTSATYAVSRWNVRTAKKEWEVVDPPATSRLAVSADGKRAALIGSMHVVHTFDTAMGKSVADVAAHGAAVAWVGFSPDGQTVHTAGETEIMSWTLKGERRTLATPPEMRHDRLQPFVPGAPLVWVAYSPNDKKSELVGWDIAKNAIGWRVPLGETIPARLFSHDGKQVVGIGWNHDAKNWDVAVFDGPAGKKVHGWALKTISRPPLWPGLALTCDGKQLVLGDADVKPFVLGDADVKALDVATGQEQRQLSDNFIKPIHAPGMPPLTISSDGTRWAVVQRNENTGGSALNVYEVKSGKRLVSHQDVDFYQPTLAFSPSGKTVALWATGGSVLIFDAESDAKPRKLDAGAARPTCAAFSPNGASLAVGYQDGTTLLWDLTAK